jgi:hypothetical protein
MRRRIPERIREAGVLGKTMRDEGAVRRTTQHGRALMRLVLDTVGTPA